MWSWFVCLILVGATSGKMIDTRDYFHDVLLWRRSRIDVKMIDPDPNTCNARLKLTLGTKSSGQSQADGIVIVCRHCERDQRLEFDIRLDGVNQPISLMPTQWRYINESVLRFGRSFGGCDRLRNQLCVLDDRCHDNEITGEDTASCCQRNETIFDDSSSHTWYYFHMRGVRSASEFDLYFETESNAHSVRNSQCGDVSISPFGTVPFDSKREELRRLIDRNQFNGQSVDTFRIAEKFTKTPHYLSAAENRSETPYCASLLFPTDIRFNADDFLRVWATARNGMDSCTWPELNAVGNCSSLRLQIVVESRRVTTSTDNNNDINMEVCADFTQVERWREDAVYAAALSMAAILSPDMTSSDDTSGRVTAVKLNVPACLGADVRVVVDRYMPHLPPQHTTESGIRPSIIPTSVPVTLSRSLTPTTTTLRPSTGSSASATGHVTGTGSRPTTTPERLTGFTSETTSTAPRSVSTSPTVTTSDTDDLGNYTQVAYYLLQFHIEAEFNPELENTSSDIYRRYNETLSPLLHTAIGRVVGRRLIRWYRTLAFRNGSVLTTTGFSVYGVLRNETQDHLKDSVHDTLNATLVVDRNNIYIIRQFLDIEEQTTAVASHSDSTQVELIGIGCALGVLLLIVIVVLVFVARHHYRYRKEAPSPQRTPAASVDNLSIPRPHPRHWQTTASMASSDHSRNRHRKDDDGGDFDDDLELPSHWNDHAAAAAPPLRRTKPNMYAMVPGLVSPPVAATRSEIKAPLSGDGSEPLRTPRLRRFSLEPYQNGGRHLGTAGDTSGGQWMSPLTSSSATTEIDGGGGAGARRASHEPRLPDAQHAGARSRAPVDGPPSVSAGAAQAHHLPNDDEVETTPYRQFDEESFSEVITYYGSTKELQSNGMLSRIQQSISKASNYLRPAKVDNIHRTPPRY